MTSKVLKGPLHAAKAFLLGSLVVATLLLMGLLSALGSPLSFWTVIALFGALLVLVGLKEPRFVPRLTMFVLFMPWPPQVRLAGFFGGVGFYVFDLLMPLALFFALRAKPRMARARFALPFLCVGIFGLAVGLIRGASVDAAVRDFRPVLYFFIALLIGGLSYRGAAQRKWILGILGFVLWYSVVGILVSTATSQSLVGGTISSPRTGVAGFDVSGIVSRFQIQSTPLALLVLCVCLCLPLTGASMDHRSARATVLLAVPSAIVVFFSYSRNSLLAVGVAVAATLIFSPRRLKLALKMPLYVLSLLLIAFPIQWMDSTWYQSGLEEVNAYGDRVLEGLSENSLRKDAGVELRRLENRYAMETFRANPIIGLGLGTKYRPVLPAFYEVFPEGIGPTYAHNLYAWYLAKTGLVGLTSLLVALAVPLARSVRGPSRSIGINLAVAAAVIGILATNFVAPYMNALNGAVMIGLSLGFLSASGSPIGETPDPAQEGKEPPDRSPESRRLEGQASSSR